MDLQTLTGFFLWCSIINGGLLIVWTLFCAFAPDLVYRTQSILFNIPRERFDSIIYIFIGLFKLAFLLFNLVPYLALRILSG